ncbi:MAG: hypothetical protein QW796_06195, partial [Thermoproteota archaeon]
RVSRVVSACSYAWFNGFSGLVWLSWIYKDVQYVAQRVKFLCSMTGGSVACFCDGLGVSTGFQV